MNHGDGVGGGITLAMFVGTLVFPACVMVGLPDVLLLAGAMGATRRAAYGLKPRPALVFLLVAAAWVVMSVPLAGALAYAAGAVALSCTVRECPRHLPNGEPVEREPDDSALEVPRWRMVNTRWGIGGSVYASRTSSLLNRMWLDLAPCTRRQLTRVAAFHVVAIMALFVSEMTYSMLTAPA